MPMWNDLFDDMEEFLLDEKFTKGQYVSDDDKRRIIKYRMKTASPEMALKYKQILECLVEQQRAQQIGYQTPKNRPPVPPGLSSGVQSIVSLPAGYPYDSIKKASETKSGKDYINDRDYEEDYVFHPYTDRPYITWCRVCELIIDKKEKCCPNCDFQNSVLVYRQKKDNIELKKERKLQAEAEAFALKKKSLPKCGDPNCIGACSVFDCFPADDKRKVVYLDVNKKSDLNAFKSLVENKNQLSVQQKKDIHKIDSQHNISITLIFLMMTIAGCGIYIFYPLFGSFWLVGSVASYVTAWFNRPKEK